MIGQKTGQLIVRFSIIFLTGQIAKKPDCPVKTGHLATLQRCQITDEIEVFSVVS